MVLYSMLTFPLKINFSIETAFYTVSNFSISYMKKINSARFQKIKAMLEKRQTDMAVIMENIQKGHNFSAIVRNCDATGVMNAWAVAHNLTAGREIQNGISKGAGKWMNMREFDTTTEAITHAKSLGMQILAAHLSDDAVDYRTVDYTKPTAIIMGQEGWGISKETATLVDSHITIPMHGMTQSLNVSVATALILYEAERQRSVAGMFTKSAMSEQEFEEQLFRFVYPELAEELSLANDVFPNAADPEGFWAKQVEENLVEVEGLVHHEGRFR